MGRARYLVDAVVIGGQSPNQLARSLQISRSWLFELLRRFREGGYPAIEPRSRRPHSCARQVAPDLLAAVLALRQELINAGDDAGPQSIAHHLGGRYDQVPSTTTVWRILKRHGHITPQPHKRPKASFILFEAELPNQVWQCDATPWQLASGSPVEILNLLDDHSRLLLNSVAYPTVKALDVVQAFTVAAANCGYPAAFLSDNAAVFSGRSRRGKVPLEVELERLGMGSSTPLPTTPKPAARCVSIMWAQRQGRFDSGQGMTMVSSVRFVDRFWSCAMACTGRAALT
jgi:transposase